MTKFKTIADYVNYRYLSLWPQGTAYHVSMSADYNSDPKRPHALMTVYPHVKGWKAKTLSGLDEHYHIPLNKRQATMLRDWLNRYLAE